MRTLITRGILAVSLLAASGHVPARAQEMPTWAAPSKPDEPPPPPPPSFGPNLPDDPAPIPVGGGLGWLVIAGAGYAALQLRRKEA